MLSSFLRLAACAVYNMKNTDPELAKWLTHFIWITAANLLHREQFSDSFIQNRLRWKSDAFKQYLRNTFYTATQHAKALKLSSSNLPPAFERSYQELEPHEAILMTAAA